VSRRRIVAYFLAGALAYGLVLVAIAPAAWIAQILERASGQVLLVRAPAGTLWSGSARLYAAARSGPPLELGEVRWRTAWSALLAGKLAADVAFGASPRAARVELTPFSASIRGLDIALPAKMLASVAPGLETFGPEGELRARTDSLRIDGDSILGLAELEWRRMRLSRAQGLELGSHVARLRGGGRRVDIELGTIEGPLRASGGGSWERAKGLSIAGAAEHGAQAAPELRNFLAAVCTAYRNNRCEFRLQR
jgi:general secretion pathway protein N